MRQAAIDLPTFTFGHLLGIGGYGEVVVGIHIRSGIKYAIKIVPASDYPPDRKMVSFQDSLSTLASSLT